MKINIVHLILWIVGAILAVFSIALGISFAIAYTSFADGVAEVFRAGLYRDLLITLIVFNFLYVLILVVFFILRKKRKIKPKLKTKYKAK